jgi:regulatory protein YycI of two-component signal transduction system YycFG
MNDPRTLTLFTVVFILLGIFNVFSGLRRMREARARGQQIAWYRQINILTGLEFILLSLLFLMSLNSSAFPSSVKPIAGIFYLVLLLLAAVLAGLVIRQAITNTRTLRKNQSSQALRNGTISAVNTAREKETTSGQRGANIQHRREHRQKAAAARRRRTAGRD